MADLVVFWNDLDKIKWSRLLQTQELVEKGVGIFSFIFAADGRTGFPVATVAQIAERKAETVLPTSHFDGTVHLVGKERCAER